jgi:hypothetical protein
MDEIPDELKRWYQATADYTAAEMRHALYAAFEKMTPPQLDKLAEHLDRDGAAEAAAEVRQIATRKRQ